jgi:hypothetical protein
VLKSNMEAKKGRKSEERRGWMIITKGGKAEIV